MTALVSIIIPTFNRSQLLGETLDSIIKQTYQHWECIIVDDHSTDYTKELLEFYAFYEPRIKYLFRPKNILKGANSCRNFGFSVSSGDYIQFFDSDDIMHPEKLNKQLKIFQKNKSIDFCLSEYSLHDSMMKLKTTRPYIAKNLLLQYLTGSAFFNLPVCLFKRSCFGNLPLNENLHKAQEVEFFIRLLQQPGICFKKISDVLVFVRLHDQNITASFKNGNTHAIRSEMKVKLMSLQYILEKGSTTDLQKFLSLYLQFLFAILDQHLYNLYFFYSGSLFFILPHQYFKKISKLFLLGFLFLVLKRRPYRFRKIF